VFLRQEGGEVSPYFGGRRRAAASVGAVIGGISFVTSSIRASSILAVGNREILDCWMYAVGVGKVALS
jgi:hypothetical protein